MKSRSSILGEASYYPFGLTMAGISSKATNTLVNNEKTFQGQRFDDDLELDWVQFKFRNHDPQIGRFIEIDPLSDKYVYNSTYAFSENHVTSHVELEGLEKFAINDDNPNQNSTIAKSRKNQEMVEAERKAAPSTNSDSKINKSGKEVESPSKHPSAEVGVQISVGVGTGNSGTQLTFGVLGSPGGLGQVFFTVSEPKPNSTEFNLDYSASVQALAGYSSSGPIDLSGKGVNTGVGGGPISASYSTNDLANPKYHVVGLGTSAGVKVSGEFATSKTTTISIPIPFVVGLLPIKL